MTKTSIKNALRRAAGGAEFATKSDIKKCLGCGNDRAAEIIRGLTFIRFSRKKLYDIDDVASRIFDNTEPS